MASDNVLLSVIIITKNEALNIRDCLESVSWADDIVIVDAKSSDATLEIANQFTTRIFIREWEGFAAAKQFALGQVKNEWVLWIDADERLTPGLQQEIQETLSFEGGSFVAFQMPRKAFFLGKWIKHCGWYPGYVTRLFRKGHASFISTQVHERLDIRGPVGRLKYDILHYTDENLFHYFNKFNRYTSLAVNDMQLSGKKYTLFDILIRPFFIFFKMYFMRLGFLDGMHGLVLSLLSSAYVFTKYAKGMERVYHEKTPRQ